MALPKELTEAIETVKRQAKEELAMFSELRNLFMWRVSQETDTAKIAELLRAELSISAFLPLVQAYHRHKIIVMLSTEIATMPYSVQEPPTGPSPVDDAINELLRKHGLGEQPNAES